MPYMDWAQVFLNGGPPCWYFDPGDRTDRFCGRAQRWEGHGKPGFHAYVSLEEHCGFRTATVKLPSIEIDLAGAVLTQGALDILVDLLRNSFPDNDNLVDIVIKKVGRHVIPDLTATIPDSHWESHPVKTYEPRTSLDAYGPSVESGRGKATTEQVERKKK